MGTLLVVIAAVLFIASIVVLVVALRRPKIPAQRGGRQDPLSSSAMPQFGPRQLGPGAIVSYGSTDYVVRGSVTFREGPFVWWEHLLEGGDQPIWFSVEEDDGAARAGDVGYPQGSQVAARGSVHRRGRDVSRVGARSRLVYQRRHDGPAGGRRDGIHRLHQCRRVDAALV